MNKMFVWCNDCGTPRLRSLAVCPVCSSRRIAVCPCGLHKQNGICAHCDQPCPTEDSCDTCAETMAGMAESKTEFAKRPHPTAAHLHDLTSPRTPLGSVGRCSRCGGRTYLTAAGEWCPRAFCGQPLAHPTPGAG